MTICGRAAEPEAAGQRSSPASVMVALLRRRCRSAMCSLGGYPREQPAALDQLTVARRVLRTLLFHQQLPRCPCRCGALLLGGNFEERPRRQIRIHNEDWMPFR